MLYQFELSRRCEEDTKVKGAPTKMTTTKSSGAGAGAVEEREEGEEGEEGEEKEEKPKASQGRAGEASSSREKEDTKMIPGGMEVDHNLYQTFWGFQKHFTSDNKVTYSSSLIPYDRL